MKKLFLLFLPILFYSCQKIDKKSQQNITDISENSVSVSNRIIQYIALKHIIGLYPNNSNNKSNDISIQIDTTIVIKDNKGRKAINIFKYKNNKGWNIISGDNRFHPIMAYNGKGEAKLDTSLNPGLKYWIDDILQQIDFMDNNKIEQTDEIKYQWDEFTKEKIEVNNLKKEPIEDPPPCPTTHDYWATWNSSNSKWEGFTTLEWGQTSGYNYYMPTDNCDPLWYYCNKYPAGCGPVAIGMVMNYYQKPNSFIFNGYPRTINYNSMDKTINPYNVNCNAPTSNVEEVGALLKYVSGTYAQLWCFSISVPFYYSSKSVTSLHPNKISETFNDWGYINSGDKIGYYDNPNHTRLIQNLKQYKPVIFSGRECDLCLSNAHIWLCEGLEEYVDDLCSTYRWVYMNWGWSGTDNGWYVLSSSYTVNGITYDNASMKIIVDITP